MAAEYGRRGVRVYAVYAAETAERRECRKRRSPRWSAVAAVKRLGFRLRGRGGEQEDAVFFSRIVEGVEDADFFYATGGV